MLRHRGGARRRHRQLHVHSWFCCAAAFRAVFPSIGGSSQFWASWSVWTWPRSSSTPAVARSSWFAGDDAIRAVSLRLAADPRSWTYDGGFFFLGRRRDVSRLCGNVREEPLMTRSCELLRARGGGVAGSLPGDLPPELGACACDGIATTTTLRSHFGSSPEHSSPEFSGLGCFSFATCFKPVDSFRAG